MNDEKLIFLENKDNDPIIQLINEYTLTKQVKRKANQAYSDYRESCFQQFEQVLQQLHSIDELREHNISESITPD